MKRISITLLAIASIMAITAKAEIVTHTLSGRVSWIFTSPDGAPATSSVFSVGKPFSLVLSYDPATEPYTRYLNSPNSEAVGIYNAGNLLFSYNSGEYIVSSSLVNYQVQNNTVNGDYFSISYLGGDVSFPSVDGYSPDPIWPMLNLQLQDTSGRFLSSEALPKALSLSAFDGGPFGDNNYVALRYGEGLPVYNVAFSIDSITSSSSVPVPEPSTYGYCGALLGIVLMVARRRKK